jgi:hypothetical protein
MFNLFQIFVSFVRSKNIYYVIHKVRSKSKSLAIYTHLVVFNIFDWIISEINKNLNIRNSHINNVSFIRNVKSEQLNEGNFI